MTNPEGPNQPEQHYWPDHLREHQIQGIVDVFIPLPIHLDLETRLSRLLRSGYVAQESAYEEKDRD